MLDAFKDFITGTIADYGYVAIFVLMLLESACIPIPSEVTMVFGGALTSSAFAAAGKELDFVAVVAVGTMANLVGSWLAYWVGLAGGRPLIERWGRYVLVRRHEVDRAHAWFERHGEAAVFFSRLLPVVRTFISLPAGVAGMPFLRFSLYTFIGCLPWSLALTGAGFLLGENWETFEAYFQPVSIAVGALLLALIVWWVVRRLRARRAEGGGPPPEYEPASTPGRD
jgi:membrane protein DedA with SNARE-associated domain